MTGQPTAAEEREDLGDYLHLFGPVTWLLYALFVVAFSVQALLLGGAPMHTPLGVGAFVLFLASAMLFAIPGVTPLSRWRTVAIIVVVVVVTVAITWQQPFHDRAPGYVAWDLGGTSSLLFCLAIRARILAAWIGEAAVILLVCVWSVQVTGAPWYGLSISYGQPVVVLACTVFAIGLHRTVRRIIDYRTAERDRQAERARMLASEADRERELKLVRDLAGPTLSRIAEGLDPDPVAVRGLEAALRDVIRGRSLMIEPLPTTLRMVRERGVDVTVLDDLGGRELSHEQLVRAAGWCAERVTAISSGSVTLRIAAVEAGAVVTATRDGALAGQLELVGAPARTPA